MGQAESNTPTTSGQRWVPISTTALLTFGGHSLLEETTPPDFLLKFIAATELMTRVEDSCRMEDLAQAILLFRNALSLCPPEYSDRWRMLNDLSFALMTRYENFGYTEDLEDCILVQRNALSLCPPDHPDRAIALSCLAYVLETYFEQSGNVDLLQESITLGRHALSLRPPGHPDHSLSLANFANSLLTRYTQLGNLEDLEDSISLQGNALSLRPPGHPLRSMSLNNLAIAVLTRFRQLGKMEDLQASTVFHRIALSLRPAGHPHRSISLDNLAGALVTRYKHLGNVADLEESIGFYQDALSLRLLGHPDRSTTLNHLANALMTRYGHSGKVEDLENSILSYHDALNLRPPGDPRYSITLGDLATTLLTRFMLLGNTEDLEDSISLQRATLSLHHHGHPLRSISLSNLANALLTRFTHSGKLEDLEEVIKLRRDTLSLRPPGHPDRSMSLNNLAHTLMIRYTQFGHMDDLEASILLQRDALSLRPPGHPHRCMSLNNLANALLNRYMQLGKMEDLEESTLLHRDALSLHHPDHPDHSSLLCNLASTLMTRYQQLGNANDLGESISLQRDALELCPPGHADHALLLGNLSGALLALYGLVGEMEVLEDSIALQHNALSLYPPGHVHRSMSLSNVGTVLLTRFIKLGKIEDLEESILFHRDVLSLRPPGHPDRSISLDNLAGALVTRYEKLGNAKDLEESILHYRDALSLHPPGHSLRSKMLGSLANTLMICYGNLANVGDLEYSLLFPHIFSGLQQPKDLAWRTKDFGKKEDFEEAILLFTQAASDSPSYLNDRLQASIRWVHFSRAYKHECTLSAYKILIQLVIRSLIFRPSVESQQQFLASVDIPRSLASDAASAAIEAGNIGLAVEFLEQGRAMLWSKVDAYKSPLEQLRLVKDAEELADRLQTLGAQLESLVLSSRITGISETNISTMAASIETQMKRHRILSEEWENLVGEIQKIDGFRNFLEVAPFHTLQSAAAEGPVILVNISNYRSDAIILLKENSPVLVHLPEVRPIELRDQAKKRSSKREIVSVLRLLWDVIISPIVDRLTELGIPKKSRIWWCPTAELCALPLHAAGPHRNGKSNLSDLYTCSYTSTLSALIRARSNIVQPSTNPKLLVVGQPSETLKLERVETEVNIVKELSPGDCVDVLFGSEAHYEAVLTGLKQHSWIHFACHGHLGEDSQPFQASFELHDGRRLPLLDLIRARIPNAELAFLSACHSAEGDSRTPDENIHLSAALQFCGFRSVVGTMWEMDDEDGPMISEEFYKYMFRNPNKIDFRDSAHALSKALKEMKRAKVPLERLVLFVHIGA